MASYEYYNPNPAVKPKKNGKYPNHTRCDCVIRSLCCATGLSWEEVYKKATESALKVYDSFTGPYGTEQVMKDFGFEKQSYKFGAKREKVVEFANNHKGEIAIVNLAGHVVCVKDGKYYDTWDCGQKTAYNYWVKK